MAATKIPIELSSTPGIVDNSNATAITIDSNENVGIGTSSPSGILHIDMGTPDIVAELSADSPTFTYRNGSGSWFHAGKHPTNDYFYIGRGATTTTNVDMVVDSFGKVGIATTSPTDTLSVGTLGSGTPTITIGSGTANSGYLYFGDGTGADRYRGFLQYTHSTDSLQLGSAGSERMRIDSSGNVGIGLTAPTQLLDVNGNARILGGLNLLTSTSYNADPASYLIVGAVNDTSVNAGKAYQWKLNTEGDANDQDLVFSALDRGAGSFTEYVRFQGSGNVGIGTTSPNTKLDVIGSSTNGSGIVDTLRLRNTGTLVNDGAKIQFTAGTSTIGAGIGSGGQALNSADLRFYSGGNTERMRIDSSGNVLHSTTDSNLADNTSGGGTVLQNGGGFQSAYTGNVGVLNRMGSDGSTLEFRNRAVVVGSVSTTSSSTTYNTSSDARLKDVTGSARGLEVINALNPVSYNWKADGKADEGLIAQEVLEIVPNAVSGSEEKYYQMDYSKLVTHLVAGMKEQQVLIEELKTRIETLENS